ncbi:hypothetical protein AB3X94_37400 [Paraburkholderia sp. BR10923]|uniref:hypothetical protein n=1 Tax=Paraburkholderia sp. BR10923 TaxID=3236992 RepID=UPI0034CDBA3B
MSDDESIIKLLQEMNEKMEAMRDEMATMRRRITRLEQGAADQSERIDQLTERLRTEAQHT